MLKNTKLWFNVWTGLLSALMLFSAGMYLFNNGEVVKAFTKLEFPLFIIYPLAIAKILGVIGLWAPVSRDIKIFVYSGFFFNLLLAFGAHMNIGDGEQMGAVLGLVFAAFSFRAYRQLNKN
jgi:hypothetical protein